MALPEIKASATDARLADLTAPIGAAWADSARKRAHNSVVAMGLPHKRDEYWRYTDPSALVEPTVDAAPADAETALSADRACLKVVFVDGAFDAAQSDDLTAENLEITTLEQATAADIHWAKEVFGVCEAAGQRPVERPLAALNTAFASAGIVLRATGAVAKPVLVVYQRTATATDVMVHHVIRVDEGASLTVLETGTGGARFSQVMEVELADKAAFHHIRTQGPVQERQVVTHCFAKVAAEASFKSFTMAANGTLTRNECVIEITGDDATAHVAGTCLGDGGDFHHDDTVFITHDAVNCESRQVFKKVLRNGATGVFQGKILVKADAQKTDGYQISQSLLLDDDSQFLAKPELEIYADDVACSHGSTSGAIDETALFYLRSRGVPHREAIDLLTLAFLAEALEEVDDAALAEDLRAVLEDWLAMRG